MVKLSNILLGLGGLVALTQISQIKPTFSLQAPISVRIPEIYPKLPSITFGEILPITAINQQQNDLISGTIEQIKSFISGFKLW